MSTFGSGLTEDLIKELRDNGEHEEADRILKEDLEKHSSSGGDSGYFNRKKVDDYLRTLVDEIANDDLAFKILNDTTSFTEKEKRYLTMCIIFLVRGPVR